MIRAFSDEEAIALIETLLALVLSMISSIIIPAQTADELKSGWIIKYIIKSQVESTQNKRDRDTATTNQPIII